jgi:hypothetical protein
VAVLEIQMAEEIPQLVEGEVLLLAEEEILEFLDLEITTAQQLLETTPTL